MKTHHFVSFLNINICSLKIEGTLFTVHILVECWWLWSWWRTNYHVTALCHWFFLLLGDTQKTVCSVCEIHLQNISNKIFRGIRFPHGHESNGKKNEWCRRKRRKLSWKLKVSHDKVNIPFIYWFSFFVYACFLLIIFCFFGIIYFISISHFVCPENTNCLNTHSCFCGWRSFLSLLLLQAVEKVSWDSKETVKITEVKLTCFTSCVKTHTAHAHTHTHTHTHTMQWINLYKNYYFFTEVSFSL